tara:strand:- start:51 stop:260 length:210 start_codon:yes stop_codon:yes gene_type:complete
MILPLFFLTKMTNAKAVMPLKNWIWNNIIDTKLGWHDDIQCAIDEIDIDELMNDRAEEYNTGREECYDL